MQKMAKATTSREVSRGQRQPVRLTLATLVKTETPVEIGRAYREQGYRLSEIAQHLGHITRRLRAATGQGRKNVPARKTTR